MAASETYRAALDYLESVRSANAWTHIPLGSLDPGYRLQTAPIVHDRARLEQRWQMATTDSERETIARDAVRAAVAASESIPGAPLIPRALITAAGISPSLLFHSPPPITLHDEVADQSEAVLSSLYSSGQAVAEGLQQGARAIGIGIAVGGVLAVVGFAAWGISAAAKRRRRRG